MFVVTGKLISKFIACSLVLALSISARTFALAPSTNTILEQSSFEPPVNEVIQRRKIIIDVPSRTLSLMEGTRVLKRFPVGVGRIGFPTPLGQFQVIHKVKNPGWENPYQKPGAVKIRPSNTNPLGTRWIGFKENAHGEYGMHGTDRPASVGKLSSHGCVRMRVPDAETLYDLVEIGTPVEVTYQVAHLSEKGDDIVLTVYPDYFKKGRPSVSAVSQDIQKRYANTVQINPAMIAAALKAPSEKPIVVGKHRAIPTVFSNPPKQAARESKQAASTTTPSQ